MESLRTLTLGIDNPLSMPTVPHQFLDCSLLDEVPSNLDGTIQNGAPFPFAVSPVVYSEIESATMLAQGEDVKTVLDLEINIEEHKIDFLPGDSIGIIPENPIGEVFGILKCLELLGKEKNLLKTFVKSGTIKKNAKVPPHIPSISTPENILKKCVEIRAVPKKGFIRALSEYTSDITERRRLHEFCSRECAADYQTFFLENGFTLLDLLENFQSCKPSFALLLEHLPRLQSRPYSIASSPLDTSNIHIVFSVIEAQRGRKGICTGWLEDLTSSLTDISSRMKNLSLGEQKKIKIPVYFRTVTKFRVPACPNVPLIMVGPGTGVAPFIGFLRHRRAQRILQKQVAGESTLYFGCRYSTKDHIFKNEMQSFLKEGDLSNLFTCFSRERTEEKPKYVQDAMIQGKYDIADAMLNQRAYLFLCGEGTKMMKDIEETLILIIQNFKGISKIEAVNLIKELERDGKLLKDNWN